MSANDNLTYLQKVAIKGEVAFALSTAIHDAEIKYRIYLILKEVDKNFVLPLIEAFKEDVTFDEEIVDQLYFESQREEIPVWLWIDKNIADIKESIKLSDASIAVSKTSINKTEERKKLVESAFVFFARKSSMASPTATKELCLTILNDQKLSFLHASCFYILEGCDELLEAFPNEVTDERILDCSFDIREMLSTVLETEALRKTTPTKEPAKVIHEEAPTEKEISFKIKVNHIHTNGSSDQNENVEEFVSGVLSQKILETFKEFSSSEPSEKYVVQKIFNDSQILTDIRTCDSEKEAREFIQNIKKQYPELQKTCNFIICKRKGKNVWGTIKEKD